MTGDLLAAPGVEISGRRAGPRRFVFLDVLRAIAVCLVVYSHVVGIWLHQHQENSVIARAVQGFVSRPLVLTLNLGNLGVAMFFLVSGFIVTHTGFTETPRQYAIKRLLRIYPMLVVAVLVSAALFAAGLHPLTTGDRVTVTPWTVLTNASLVNYVLSPRVVLLDVGWTLVVEVLFYALLLATLPLLRRTVWPVIAGELAVLAAIVAVAHRGGPVVFAFAGSAAYVSALLVGQIVWAVWSRRIPLWAGLSLGACAWLEYRWAWSPGMGNHDPAYDYDLNLALALVLFLAGLLAEPRLRPVRWIGYLADRSYSLYLLHGLLAFVVLNALAPRIGYPGALLAGLTVTALGVEAGFRFVERPCMRLARRAARRLAGSRRSRPSTEDENPVGYRFG